MAEECLRIIIIKEATENFERTYILLTEMKLYSKDERKFLKNGNAAMNMRSKTYRTKQI